MKLYLIFFALISLATSQTYAVGVTFAVNSPSFSGDFANSHTASSEIVLGADFGGLIRGPLHYRASILYDRYTYAFSEVADEGTYNITLDLAYLSVAPQLVYHINQNLPVFLGASAKFNLNSQETREILGLEFNNNAKVEDAIFGVQGGFGYKFRTRMLQFEPRFTYEYIFTNVLKSGDISSKMSQILFGITISFK